MKIIVPPSRKSRWPERWTALADRLEVALENKVYRTTLCLATVALVLIYVFFATRLAQPSRWIPSQLITVQEAHREDSQPPSFLEIDEINRSIVRLHQWASVLKINPAPLVVRFDEFKKERVLRIWLEDLRSQSQGGIFDLVPETVAQALARLLDDSRNENMDPDTAPKVSAETNWFAEVRTMRETCLVDKSLQSKSLWKSLCKKMIAETRRSDFDRPSPLSLKNWLTSQIVAEARALGTAERISYLRRLVRSVANPQLLKLESLEAWPLSSADFESNIRQIVSVLAPSRVENVDFSPRLESKIISLARKNHSKTQILHDPMIVDLQNRKIKLSLLVLKACEAPTVAEVLAVKVQSQETVWVKSCESVIYLSKASAAKPLDLTSVSTVREMAEKNRDVSFVQIGIPETELALKRGWLKSKTKVTDAAMHSTGLLRAQRIDRDRKWNTVRYRAPVEAIKLARQ